MYIPTTRLTSGGGGLFSAYAQVSYQLAQNTAGGDTSTGVWIKVPVNTEDWDTANLVSVASGQITIASAGNYFIQGWSLAYLPNARHQSRLQNVTDASTSITGSSNYSPSTGGNVLLDRATVSGRITIAGSKTYELQHIVQAGEVADGLGVAANFTTEVFAEVLIWKET